MWIVVVLLIICLVLLYTLLRRRRVKYKCFLLTLKDSEERRNTFLSHHDPGVPLEIIYSVNTKEVENAKKYQKVIDPGYFKEALRLHYGKKVRKDITYFDMGAIGCYMGHMEFYRRCFEQGLKYAVIFEDNVIIKSPKLYGHIQSVIDVMGDDFEMCFFHCLSRYPDDRRDKGLERVKWISSTKCYLVHVENMKKYYSLFFPIDNHVDMKHEDLIAKGARVYYKDLRDYMMIDRSHSSTIGHSDWGRKKHFSKQYPSVTTDSLEYGY